MASRRFKFKEGDIVSVGSYGNAKVFQRRLDENPNVRGGFEKFYLLFFASGRKPVWMLESQMKKVRGKFKIWRTHPTKSGADESAHYLLDYFKKTKVVRLENGRYGVYVSGDKRRV